MTLRARGGSGVFVWKVAAGQLPPGVRIGLDGSIAGTPRTPGTFRFAARAKDTEARSLIWQTKVSVAPTLRIQTRTVPAAKIGRRYSAALSADGGVAPIDWKLTRGRLPRGIRLASAHGELTGVPKEAGTHLVSLQVSDGLKVKKARTFRIVVLGGRGKPRR